MLKSADFALLFPEYQQPKYRFLRQWCFWLECNKLKIAHHNQSNKPEPGYSDCFSSGWINADLTFQQKYS